MTTEEMIAALEELAATQEGDGHYTMREWVQMSGLPIDTVKQRMTTAKDMRRLSVKRIPVEALDGTMRPSPHYRIVPAAACANGHGQPE